MLLTCFFVAHNFRPFTLSKARAFELARHLRPFPRRRGISAVIMADKSDPSSRNDYEIDHKGRNSCYRVSAVKDEKWICISFDFDPLNGTSSASLQNLPSRGKQVESLDRNITKCQKATDKATSSQESAAPCIPESVLQYERQLRKIQAADRASKTDVNVNDHLHTLYCDDHIVVTNKPSGILCVPGVNKYKSLLDLVFEVYGSAETLPRDSMIVHRLDMDTSGVVIFARTRTAMSNLHRSFRERAGTKKIYEALLVGWLDINYWIENADQICSASIEVAAAEDRAGGGSFGGGEINLPLQRDHRHPPFMRVSTPESEAEARQAVADLNHAGYKKLIAKKPKQSATQFRILSHEMWMGHPVTRVELMPITGRTHQLRVHCSALGHPILGDPAYGFCGEAHPNGGFTDAEVRILSPTCAPFELRRDVEEVVRETRRTMCLHARRLTLLHPVTNEQVSFDVDPSF
ncbi:hypothetical protein ACHAWF_017313 [Thalassiosira exigua]